MTEKKFKTDKYEGTVEYLDGKLNAIKIQDYKANTFIYFNNINEVKELKFILNKLLCMNLYR